MPVRLSRFYPPSENAILCTLTAAWFCKPLFSYFQSGRIWHCFLHSFPTKLAHLHIGCKCPSNDIGGFSQDRWNIRKRYLFPAGFVCYERQRSCEWLQRTPCPPRAAPPPPMDGLHHHPPPPAQLCGSLLTDYFPISSQLLSDLFETVQQLDTLTHLLPQQISSVSKIMVASKIAFISSYCDQLSLPPVLIPSLLFLWSFQDLQ